MIEPEVVLRYEGDKWIALYRDRAWRSSDRHVLEKQVVEYFKHLSNPPRRIHMRFDMQSIPRWFHQYQTHYFNQILEIS